MSSRRHADCADLAAACGGQGGVKGRRATRQDRSGMRFVFGRASSSRPPASRAHQVSGCFEGPLAHLSSLSLVLFVSFVVYALEGCAPNQQGLLELDSRRLVDELTQLGLFQHRRLSDELRRR